MKKSIKKINSVSSEKSWNELLTFEEVYNDFKNLNELYKGLTVTATSTSFLMPLSQGFIPAEHLHDIGDLYGFEYVVEAINRLGKVMLMGVDLQRDSIMDYVDQRIASNNSRSNRAYAQFRLEG